MTGFPNVSPKYFGLSSPEGLLIEVFLSLRCGAYIMVGAEDVV